MVGSDRFDLDESLFERPAVLRVGFKAYPACWHLQGYLKTFDALRTSVEPDDEIMEILVRGPRDVEKFCAPEIQAPTDTAFSLPSGFSLLLCGIEPGPQWVEHDNDSRALRHRDLLRFEPSSDRSVEIRTRAGRRFQGATSTGDMRDLSSSGLNDGEVLEKYQRLTDPALRGAAAAALSDDKADGAAAARFYKTFCTSITRPAVGA